MFEEKSESPMQRLTAALVVGKDLFLASSRVNSSNFTDGQTEPEQTLLADYMALTSLLIFHG